MTTIVIVYYVLTWMALLGFTASTLAYWILAPWYTSRIGRNFMFLLLTLSLTLALVVFSTVVPQDTRLYMFIVVYGLFALSGVTFAINIIREQVGARKKTDIEKDKSV